MDEPSGETGRGACPGIRPAETEVVEGDERSIRARLNKWAKARDVTASIAHDGMARVLG